MEEMDDTTIYCNIHTYSVIPSYTSIVMCGIAFSCLYTKLFSLNFGGMEWMILSRVSLI